MTEASAPVKTRGFDCFSDNENPSYAKETWARVVCCVLVKQSKLFKNDLSRPGCFSVRIIMDYSSQMNHNPNIYNVITMFVYVCLDIFPSTSSELILDLCFCVVNRPFKLPVSLIFHHGIHNSGFQNWGPPQWTVCSPWDCTILYQLHRLLHNR